MEKEFAITDETSAELLKEMQHMLASQGSDCDKLHEVQERLKRALYYELVDQSNPQLCMLLASPVVPSPLLLFECMINKFVETRQKEGMNPSKTVVQKKVSLRLPNAYHFYDDTHDVPLLNAQITVSRVIADDCIHLVYRMT